MAPIYDLADLSPRNRAIFLAGVRGADGDDTEPTTDAPAEGATTDAAPEGAAPDAPAEGEAPAEGADAEASTDAGPAASIPALPEDLTGEAPAALQDLAHAIEAARAELQANARTQADLDAIREATERRNAIAAELQRRVDEDNAVREGLAAMAEELAAEAPLPAPAMATASATPARPSAAQVAAARGAQAPAAQTASAGPVRSRPRAALVAALSTDTTAVGSEMGLEALGDALDRTKGSLQKTIVASIPGYERMGGEFTDMLLGTGSTDRNSQMMRETREAWAAARRGEQLGARAAAICDPLDVLREIPDQFNTSEPIASMFPSRPASRLGFQFTRSVGLADLAGSTTLWDETDQDGVDPDDSATWKPCLVVDCPTPEDIKAEAVVACLVWNNTQEMSNPENIANLLNALRALRARTKEARILQRIDTLSSRYTHVGEYGAVPTVIEAINTALAQATYVNREEESMYDVILPPGLVALLRNDLAARGFEGISVTDALAYVRERVDVANVVRSLDASAGGEPSLPWATINPPGEAAEVLPTLADTYRVRLVEPSAAIYSETGQLNVGTQTSPELNRRNQTQYFAEEYLFLAKQGPAPWFSIDVTLCGNGARAGWIEPVDCSQS